MQQGFIRIVLSTVLFAVNLSLGPAPVLAQPVQMNDGVQLDSPDLALQQDGGDLVISWDLSADLGVHAAGLDAATVEAAVASMPHMPYGGYMIPMELQTVVLEDDFTLFPEAIAVDIVQAASVPYRRSLQIAPLESPKAIGWEEKYRAPEQEFQLPDQPVFVLREGRVRGTRVAVVAFSPLYADGDEVKAAYDFQARLPKARAFDDGIDALMTQNIQNVTASALRSEDAASTSLAYEPTNWSATQVAAKLYVSQPGIQVIFGSDLINSGQIPAGTALDKIQITYKGTEIAVELWDSGSNGALDPSDSMRFYAPHRSDSMTVGDYWNEVDTYWLTYSGSNGKRMVSRNVLPSANSNATIQPIGLERGIWEDNKVYESAMPGDDGDNWFHTAMTVEPSQAGDPASYPSLAINLNNKLPLATSSMPSSFTVTGSSDSVANHTLQVNLGTISKSVNWTNLQYYETWSHVISSTVAHPASLQLTLLPGALESDIRVDKVYWEQPVNLDFGNKGASFTGIPGNWRYQLANVTGDAALYDVTDPAFPDRLIIPSGSNPQFEDGPEPRDYILATVGDLGAPTIVPHQPVTWSPAMRAHALYIASAEFHDELQPLIDFRIWQGYEAMAVDLQAVYDSWSYGMVSPDAVRNMLQYAVNNWALKPVSAVAVGDTTIDPKNFQGRMNGISNKNVFPTFFEPTDPWLGETACDSCFVQLDDPHPLDGILDPDFLIDMWFGRFSVQDEEQLEAVVTKVVDYGQPTDLGLNVAWRQQSVFVADNYVRGDCTLDSAGDFAKSSDSIINQFQARSINSTRVFYDPSPALDPSCAYYNPQVKPGRYSTPAAAQTAAVQAYRNGAGLITFDGHSNHFQNGRTEQNDGYIMGFNEILQMRNAKQLPIILEMTCYTGQFQYLSTTGTTMDERFQRHPGGGAVAIFAPAGLSVATGHHFLQEGFHNYLWSHPNYQSRLGELVEASYFSLFENSTCCQDVRETFHLLGDPLTNALVLAPQELFIPLVEYQ